MPHNFSHNTAHKAARKTTCKTVCQYNRMPLSDADMQKLADIAKDYCAVKNYVYQRYGGIVSLPKLYPGYTIQNEMTASGLRSVLGIPSVYFYLAVFDALGDIKSQWARTKTAVRRAVGANANFTETEKHYLRFLIKTNDAFEGVLMQKPPDDWELPDEIRMRYEELLTQLPTSAKPVSCAKKEAEAIVLQPLQDKVNRLHRYLCRQVRKHHAKSHSDTCDGFFSSNGTHRYSEHGIYLTTKERRRRIFIPLTDGNQYKSQIYVKLIPERNGVELKAAIQTAVHFHPDYVNQVGISLGMSAMLTTHKGHIYGKDLGTYQNALSAWIREQTGKYNANRNAGPGRAKYNAKKHRMKEFLHSYINMELNRFLREEKPENVYLPKLPPPKGGSAAKIINYSAAMWQRGYIRERLEQKCREHAVGLVKVYAGSISRQCSRCSAYGCSERGNFRCPACGYEADAKINAAKNAKIRGNGTGVPCADEEEKRS